MKKLLSTILLTLAMLMPTALWAQSLAGDSAIVAEAYVVLSTNSTGSTLTFYYDDQKENREGWMPMGQDGTNITWANYAQGITKVVFDESFANCTTLTSTTYWFKGFSSLTSIEGIEYLKTDNVWNMSQMFFGCSGLDALDVSSFKTTNATDMYDMFRDCSGLTTLDLSYFDTNSVTDMSKMFSGCSNLKTIYVGDGWSVEKVENSGHMFYNCSSIVGGAGTAFDAEHVDYTYAHIDEGPTNPGYFTRSGDEPYQPVESVWAEQLENGDAEKPWVNPDTRWNDEENNYKICAWGKTKGRNMTEDGNGWNAFPADIEEEEGGNGNHVFVVHATKADTPNDDEGNDVSSWDNQFWIQSPRAWSAGTKHRIKFRYKASQNVDVVTQVHKQNPSDYLHYTAIGNISFTTDWQQFDGVMIVDSDMDGCWSIAFNLNSDEKSPTDFYFDNLSWSAYMGDDISPDAVIVNLVNNGDMEGDDNSNYFVKLDLHSGNERPSPAVITDGVGMDGSRGIKVEVGARVGEVWDNQFWLRLNQPVSEGTRFRMSFDYRADKEADVAYEMHAEPCTYIYIPFFTGYDNPFHQDWEHFEYEGVMRSTNSTDQLPFQSFTFTLSLYEGANIYYFDNFKFEVVMEDQCPKPTFKQKGNEISIYSPFNATIYYTLDGSTPTVNSAVYSAPIKLMQNAELKAIAVVEGRETSPVATYEYESSTFDSNGVLTVNGAMTLPDAIEVVGGREEVAKTITAIVWNSYSIPFSSDLQELDNPNMLVYIQSSAIAPVSKVDNVIVEGVAKNVVLTDAKEGNNNFYCPQAFTAEKVAYTRNFQQHTQVGVSQGWESIALPFNVQTITHEKQGVIAPFGNTASEKHFWLRRLGDSGLIQATKVEANVPYVISMPNNNEVYNADYNLSGKVTFTAQDVVVPVTAPVTLAMADNSVLMVPAFQSVGRSSDVWALNVGEVRGQYLEGSAFERDYREIRPFEAYTVHRSNTPAPRFVPIKDMTNGDVTGIEDVRDMMSDGRGEGAWYDLNGRKLQGQPKQKGVYILNGMKVVIK